MTENAHKLITAYVYDADLRIEANRQGKNYWYEYIREMNEQLGLRTREMSRHSLEDATALSDVGILFIGDLTASQVTDAIKSNLDAWVKAGGVLIGFATEGLDEIFGNACDSIILQPESDYTISGSFSLKSDQLTTDVHSYLHPDQKLIIFSNIRKLVPKSSTEIARLYGVDGADTGYTAITKRHYHKGHAYYFAFNVPQTIWVLHQGIPITFDRDGDGYYRTGDLIAIRRDDEREVLYADEILFLIQNMLAQKPQPLIYPIPPKDNQIPDALFYWGGDDEAMAGIQVWASNWMKEKGLPYHINIMRNKEGKYAVTPEEVEAIRANGHEPSLHYNFIDNFDPGAFTEEDVQEQAEAFYKTFGFHPICAVNHWCRWTGWSETARWLRKAGSRADNSFTHHPLPPMNPTNRMGFVFGTAYPFYFYDDYRGENAKIDFLEEPITAYEVGYSATDVTDFDIVHKVIDIATKYHLTMDMFYHPIYIHSYPACRTAIEEALRYIKSKGIIAVHKGNDGIWEWWDKRSRSHITDVTVKENSVSFTAHCEYDDGMIVKVPVESVTSVRCSGQHAAYKIRKDLGRNWVYVVVPAGTHTVEIWQ
jgi:hypothetical protein